LSTMDADLWQEAISDEMDYLESSRTWHLVDFYWLQTNWL
jgi:hypothetical protein